MAGLAGAIGFDALTAVRRLIQAHWQATDVVLTDSGTSALALAIAASVRANRLVAIPAYGCYDLATAVAAADARAVLYDVDPETLAPNLVSLQRSLDAGAGAVVVAELYGVPVDLDVIQQMVAASGAILIEDAAQAIGTEWHGRPAGGSGAFGVLSFGRGKGLNGGGGGALLANTAEAAHVARASSVSGSRAPLGFSSVLRATAQWALARPSLFAIPAAFPFLKLGETVYRPPHAPGPLSKASSQMLATNWPDAQAAVHARRDNAMFFRRAAAGTKWKNVSIPEGGKPGFLRLPLLGNSPLTPAELRAAAPLGIMPGYPMPLSELSEFRARCNNTDADFAGAHYIATHLLTLPVHALLGARDRERIVSWIISAE